MILIYCFSICLLHDKYFFQQQQDIKMKLAHYGLLAMALSGLAIISVVQRRELDLVIPWISAFAGWYAFYELAKEKSPK
jgi:TRAP-type uncharacterized transport system fused permease subunit